MSKIIVGALAAALIIVTAVLSALPAMLLWNWLMPRIFELPAITFWEAFGLVLLASIFFKSSSSS